MNSLHCLVLALAIGLAVSSSDINNPLQTSQLMRNLQYAGGICSELLTQLSPATSVYCPQDPEYETAIVRWSDFSSGSFTAVVEPASIEDIAACVSLSQICSLILTVPGQICQQI